MTCVDAGLLKPLTAHFSQHIGTDSRAEGHAIAEKSQIVSENGRRAAQCEGKTSGQNFALFRQLLRQTVDNQVRIESPTTAKSGRRESTSCVVVSIICSEPVFSIVQFVGPVLPCFAPGKRVHGKPSTGFIVRSFPTTCRHLGILTRECAVPA